MNKKPITALRYSLLVVVVLAGLASLLGSDEDIYLTIEPEAVFVSAGETAVVRIEWEHPRGTKIEMAWENNVYFYNPIDGKYDRIESLTILTGMAIDKTTEANSGHIVTVCHITPADGTLPGNYTIAARGWLYKINEQGEFIEDEQGVREEEAAGWQECRITVLPKLHVGKEGDGTVTSQPAGIACGADCDCHFGPGETVSLTAMPAEDYVFGGWSGDCAGDERQVEVVMDGNKNCTAKFVTEPSLTVSVTGEGVGTILITGPSGTTECETECTMKFPLDAEVQLTAVPDTTYGGARFVFDGWSGDCEDATEPSVILRMDDNKTCAARFSVFEIPDAVVQVNVFGEGQVFSEPDVFDCVPECPIFDPTIDIELRAEPAEGWRFSHWSGHDDCLDGVIGNDGDPEENLRRSGAERQQQYVTCTANFVPIADEPEYLYELDVSTSGNGSGTVSGRIEPDDIIDPEDFPVSLVGGTEVTLTAEPDADSVFENWTGDCQGDEEETTVVMDAAKNCEAVFSAPLPDTDPPVWDGSAGIMNIAAGDQWLYADWGPATDAGTPPVEYLVYVDVDSDPWDNLHSVTSELGIHIPGLPNGNTFYVGVRCQDSASPPNADDNTAVLSALANPVVDTLPPVWDGPAGILSLTPGSVDNTLVMSWGRATDYTPPVVYLIHIDHDNDGDPWNDEPIEYNSRPDTTTEVGGLVAGREYLVGVRCRDGAVPPNVDMNTNVLAATPTGIVDTAPPVWDDQPGILYLGPLDNGIQVGRGTATDDTLPVVYMLYIDYDNDQNPWNDTPMDWTDSNTSMPVWGLAGQREYYVGVRCRDSAIPPNTDQNTVVMSVTTTGMADTDPPVWNGDAGITHFAADNTRIIAAWGDAYDQLSPPAIPLLYLDTDNYPWDQAPIENVLQNDWTTVPGLVPGQEYWAGVRYRDQANPPNIDTNTVVLSAIALSDPDPPHWDDSEGIKSLTAGDGELTAYWGAATDVSLPVDYLVYVDTDNNPWDQIPTPVAYAEIEWQITGLTNGQEYWVGVRCRDSADPRNIDDNTKVLSAIPTPGGVPPTASFTVSPNPVQTGNPVTFDASGSTDDGTINVYAWDFDNNGTFDATGDATSHRTTQFVYGTAGTYHPLLRVTDNDSLSHETTRQIQVQSGGGNPTLTVVNLGFGNGTVVSDPAGIDCVFSGYPSTPYPCSATFQQNQTVLLTPTATSPSVFSHWEGCDDLMGPEECIVIMNGMKTVTAYFE